jgi:hypothetical protein
LNSQNEAELLRDLLAAAGNKPLYKHFSEGHGIADFHTLIYRRSKHPEELISMMQPYTFSQMAAHLFPVSVAQQPQRREAGQHTT